MEKILLSWSGGKDCGLALQTIRQENKYDVVALIVSINKKVERISRHGIRTSLLQKQSNALGIPIQSVDLDNDFNRTEFEEKLECVLKYYSYQGINKIAYGDIARYDLRKRRQDKLAAIGFQAIFPIWDLDTSLTPQIGIDMGFKSVITCINTNVLDKSYLGRTLDIILLSQFPLYMDKNGENDEYHTFLYDGPIFKNHIEYQIGEFIEIENRCYCDIY